MWRDGRCVPISPGSRSFGAKQGGAGRLAAKVLLSLERGKLCSVKHGGLKVSVAGSGRSCVPRALVLFSNLRPAMCDHARDFHEVSPIQAMSRYIAEIRRRVANNG